MGFLDGRHWAYWCGRTMCSGFRCTVAHVSSCMSHAIRTKDSSVSCAPPSCLHSFFGYFAFAALLLCDAALAPTVWFDAMHVRVI